MVLGVLKIKHFRVTALIMEQLCLQCSNVSKDADGMINSTEQIPGQNLVLACSDAKSGQMLSLVGERAYYIIPWSIKVCFGDNHELISAHPVFLLIYM